MTRISRTATFAPDDAFALIVEDLACPACGRQDPQTVSGAVTNNRIHVFCDACGAFVTIALDDEQARAIGRCAGSPSG